MLYSLICMRAQRDIAPPAQASDILPKLIRSKCLDRLHRLQGVNNQRHASPRPSPIASVDGTASKEVLV